MNKHTPGPWEVETVTTACGICHKVGPFPGRTENSKPRHACLYSDYNCESNPADIELIANARLIAAAPELLAALQWYEAKAVQMGRAAIRQDSKLMLSLMKEVAVEYGAQARAAIAKATGEQP